MTIWLPVGFQDDEEDGSSNNNNAQPLIPSFKSQIELARIIQRMLDQLYSAHHSNMGASRRRAVIDAVNVDLCRWEDALGKPMKWNKWRPVHERLVPTVAALQYVLQTSFALDPVPQQSSVLSGVALTREILVFSFTVSGSSFIST